jgi:D-aspartate ligase
MFWFSAYDVDLRRFRAEAPPAVLLGGLNVARAIARGGIPLVVASADAESPVFASRHCRGRLLLPPLEGVGALEKLLELGERLRGALGRPMPLFYGDDNYLALVLRHRARLARCYRFLVNDPEVAAAMIDKERFDAFMRARDLPVPRAADWEALAALPGPVLVKPKSKVCFDDSAAFLQLFGRDGKARVYASAGEALADPRLRAVRRDVIFQEYIAGGDGGLWSFHGYADEEGRVLDGFTGRKIRTSPPFTGRSSYLRLAPNERLAALGRDIARRTPLKGVFKMDFKQDPRSGRFVLLEVNARFTLWHYLAAANGLNLPRIAYDHLLEGRRPAGPAAVRATYRWLNLRLDFRAYRELAARGELSAARWLASLAASRKVYDLFAWSDPLPFVRQALLRLQRLARVPSRLRRWRPSG